MAASNVTRGYGFLEGFLAIRRSRTANHLIPANFRKGRILDIGCGSYPLFLLSTEFAEKYGVDKVRDNRVTGRLNGNLTLTECDIEEEGAIPFESCYFDVVTMLAVFEHIDPAKLVQTICEVRRVLKPRGIYIMTTPAFWTDRLLRFMAKLKLVSSTEIEEHKAAYKHSQISSVLQQSGFPKKNLQFGYFEMFMNLWATAIK